MERQSDNLMVQFVGFKVENAWKRLDESQRAKHKQEFVKAYHDSRTRKFAYSLVGLKPDVDFLMWHTAGTIEELQETFTSLLKTQLGTFIQSTIIMTGILRRSQYVKKPTPQEQSMLTDKRSKYIIVYPFTKTTDWYLLSRDTRQGMMNEHIRIGHQFKEVRQMLAYSTGIDNQEFIVAYETDDLVVFQDLVIALRATEARRYTHNDLPILTGVFMSIEEIINQIG